MSEEKENAELLILSEIQEITGKGVVVGRSGKENKVRGLSTKNNIKILTRVFQEFKPQRTMEIGLAFGASALAFTRLFALQGEGPRSQHTAIDPFQEKKDVWDSTGLLAIEKRGLSGYLRFISESSSLALPQLVMEKAQFDMIYIDGSHIFENVFVDFFYCRQLLSQKGIMLFDDSSNRHVKKVIKFIETNFDGRLNSLSLNLYQTDKNKLIYRIAEYLGKTQLRAFQKVGPDEREWNTPYTNF